MFPPVISAEMSVLKAKITAVENMVIARMDMIINKLFPETTMIAPKIILSQPLLLPPFFLNDRNNRGIRSNGLGQFFRLLKDYRQ